jgi:hypothetical protein
MVRRRRGPRPKSVRIGLGGRAKRATTTRRYEEEFVSSNGMGENAREMAQRFGPLVGAGVILVVLSVLGLSRVGCANHHVQPGHEGYIKSNPLVSAAEFIGVLEGPTSTGWVWRQELQQIDYRPRTYSEDMQILTENQLALRFRAHARIQLRRGSVKEVVEVLGGENWYVNYVQREFQRAVRDEVQRLEPFQVKDNMRKIGDSVLTKMKEQYGETPIEFISVDIGDIEYPGVVVESVIHRFVTFQENQRRDVELKIAQKQIEIGIAEARGTADAQKIIRTTLDPMFLQLAALQEIRKLSGGKNATYIIAPYSEGGNAPIIFSLDQ